MKTAGFVSRRNLVLKGRSKYLYLADTNTTGETRAVGSGSIILVGTSLISSIAAEDFLGELLILSARAI